MSEPEKTMVSQHYLKKPRIGSISGIKFPCFKKHLFKQMNVLTQIIFTITLLTSSPSFAEVIFPSGLINKLGSTSSQPLEVLTVQDQQAAEDNPNRYIELLPSATGYIGRFNFNVPASPNTTVSKLVFKTNFRGQTAASQKWLFQLLEVNTGRWVDIATNSNVAAWHWSDIASTITTPGKFINSNNRVTLRYVTYSKDTDVSQLDYMAMQVTRTATTPPPPDPDPGTPPATGADWKPAPGLKWHIQYTGAINTALNVDVYNIDLFDTSAATISTLRSKGKHV
ncbi:MAG TPA: endo alpha-1,4 polygalactosaminidase, partial [Nitrosomonas sp.]|nr:endo alpha-1,4 polygalactosaminidase [Nitrosomonas sp.]